MRPLPGRKGKALGPHLQSKGDERPGVGAQGLGGGHSDTASLTTSRVVK